MPSLPANDTEYLKSKEYDFELLEHPSGVHLVIKNFQLPSGYSLEKTDLLIQVPPGYPNTALDMFWTYPEVALANGAAPRQTETREQHHGKNWQRWSRHYSWRSGIDSIKSHLGTVITELHKLS